MKTKAIYIGNKDNKAELVYAKDINTLQEIVDNIETDSISFAESFKSLSTALEGYMIVSKQTHEEFLNELKSFLEERFNYTIIKKEGN